MSRRLKPLNLTAADQLPASCSACSFWESAGERERRCGAVCDADLQGAWYRRVTDEWGECGRVAYDADEVLGFIKYAPSGFFSQASTFAAAPQDPSVPLIACLHISADARHRGLGEVLLKAALRDLVGRGERRVEAFGYTDLVGRHEDMPMLGLTFLLKNGFSVVRPDPFYPLLRLDLRSLVLWQDNLEAVLESLRFPRRVPNRAPASWTKGP
jgi:ribosomal protein S18 acetylase RimI-like enzyme